MYLKLGNIEKTDWKNSYIKISYNLFMQEKLSPSDGNWLKNSLFLLLVCNNEKGLKKNTNIFHFKNCNIFIYYNLIQIYTMVIYILFSE